MIGHISLDLHYIAGLDLRELLLLNLVELVIEGGALRICCAGRLR